MKLCIPLIVLGLFLSGCGREASGPKPLVVGMELAYPPFEMTDEQGEPTGVSVDMAKALAEYVGRPLEIRNMAFDGLIPALKTGSIDLVISSMTATDERAKSIDFSDRYLHTELALLVPKDSDVKSVDDLNQEGRVIAVKLGTTGHVYATEHLQKADVRALQKENACVLEVTQGKVDAFLYDQLSIFQSAKRHTKSTRAILDSFQRESWAIGIQKGNEELRNEVNAFLAAFRSDGGFEELGAEYLGEFQKGFRELGIPFVFDPPASGEG